ncbi:hypothetical protein VTN00DRAFT_1406 [Thermoascus crustaceus]|uniref:uncharacterized protein n=1 Tax=Thermoascus crustaceus TaxID=5088 RepID=UPI003743EFD2
MEPIADTVPRRCSLPTLRSFSSKESDYGDKNDDRRLPPLPRVEPLPPGPFNPLTSNVFAPSPPSSQDSFSVKSPWPSSSEHGVSPPSPASSVEGSLRETFSTQKAFGWPNDFSSAEIMALVAPRNINRKPPLQQLCGRKRKGDMISGDLDDQREKHRIAEGNRRKNLSQLHRELDSRVHDFFLERAGWNPAKSLPQSKEHIVQGAIFLIDFMLVIIAHLLRQEKQIPSKLSENLQSQMRCMHLQQQVSSLQQQNQVAQQQLRAVKQENEALAERNRALEFQLKSYEQMFRSPRSEATSPKPVLAVPENKQKKLLPGLRVFCDEVAAIGAEPGAPIDPPHTGSSQTFGNPFFRSTPPTTNPSSPVYQQSSQTSPCSRRESFASTT